MQALTLLNPAHQWVKDMATIVLGQGSRQRSQIKSSMPETHANHLQMGNSITELTAHGHPMTK